ncbi:hypothetical protein PsorP6_017887 [Peronosclerospora sorghi]|uniref:Uncharacterized protein n=1 Tax=Peronosclerospora sorghi TaxID=230839 RepID=A0ACC0WDS2_9STRA|nr:hypothetical protein PsorP6_017887 [Peronosclerospora sorghi]
MEGLTLKTWRLGKKLGSGACSDVYAGKCTLLSLSHSIVESGTSLPNDIGRQFVMKLSPLPQLPAAKLKNKKRKKTPVERNADALYAEHLLYKNHLRDQSGIPYVPLGAYGEDQGYRFLVIERLGRTLEMVLQEHGPVPSETAARLGLEILETLQQMHVKNILYVDVKPENFMLDTSKENKVYCVDFGISDRYVMATGKHKDYKEGTVVGTPTFLSLNCHNGAACSRRDDIESLLYVLIYLMRGDLPWQHASSDAEGAKIKKATSVDQLCASLPPEWGLMLTSIRACGFEDRPDYDFFERQFLKLGGKKGLTTPFKWGTSKTGKAVATASASQKSTVDVSARKRVKSVDEGLTTGSLSAAKTIKSEKKRTAARPGKIPAKKGTKPSSQTALKGRKTRNTSVQHAEMQSQDRQVFKAIAGHAAATAAVKRPLLMSDDRVAGLVTYELLRTHGDLGNAETHKEILRALSSVPVDRESVQVLERFHATEYALLQVKALRATNDQVSKRRKQVREKWKGRQSVGLVKAATIQDVTQRFPKLFQGVMKDKMEHMVAVDEVKQRGKASLQTSAPVVATSPRVSTRGDLRSSTSRHAASFSMEKEAKAQNKAVLTDLVKKRPQPPHEDADMFNMNTRFKSPEQRNPFQTASERLLVRDVLIENDCMHMRLMWLYKTE